MKFKVKVEVEVDAVDMAEAMEVVCHRLAKAANPVPEGKKGKRAWMDVLFPCEATAKYVGK